MKRKKETTAKPRKAAASKPARPRAGASGPRPEGPTIAPLQVVLDNTIPGGFRMEPVDAR